MAASRVRRALGVLGGLTVLAGLLTAPAAAADPQAQAQQPVAQKPYMGWSSWSLESTNYPGVNPTGPASWLTEQHVLQQADVLAAKFKQHGYTYVNIDAGWSNSFDQYARPVVNPTTFPDGMKYVADYVHRKGLKLGSYLAVGLDLKAYNDGNSPIAGTTNCHTKDLVYPDLRKTNGWDSAYKIDFTNPCAQSYVDSVAQLLAGWGVDFLKLDGVGPGSFKGGENHTNTTDVEAWHRAIAKTGRPMEFVISWALSHRQADVWKANTNGWRVDTDVECYCDTLVTWNNSVKQRWNDVVQWIPDAGPGHWNNLDSLDVGSGKMDGLTQAERQSYMTLWAIEAAPLYLGDDLTQLDDYGVKLLTNDEVIALNQAGVPAKPVSQTTDQQVWYNRNADGSYTVALFNLAATPARVTADLAQLGITGPVRIRDLWAHKDVGDASGDLPVHGSRLFKVTPRDRTALAAPAVVHGTAATGTSVSLAWDASKGAQNYDVFANGRKVTSTGGTSATVTGLKPSTPYDFTVVANQWTGRPSAASKKISVTTPAAGGPRAYEAENGSPQGGATVYDCACSGGKKVGYLGGSGYVVLPTVTTARAGTYLMQLSYVDGDSSRTGIVTVNGTSFPLPVAGSNDDDWNTPQTVTVPVYLQAGANTVQVGNQAGYVYDVDKITV
ncbi:CBM35 domain-containing protein [Amycolatopsis mongoliensis]|uniref:Alpha-galactosidase n=1 Tax=Amycolatopsis mongoliensis TaxID=715475 RepID=A0A9Y2JTE2_9PSEU|nr:CBM35 domain-containing protein [Amycolatopsis sp. 4-36]WIY03157.1 CBM35 domain-containing protein [Amycolatopsis sp. 4-36]